MTAMFGPIEMDLAEAESMSLGLALVYAPHAARTRLADYVRDGLKPNATVMIVVRGARLHGVIGFENAPNNSLLIPLDIWLPRSVR